jgi:hypothetical protein
MRRDTLFWGSILILAGILLMLGNLGVLEVNVWSLIWPLFLIALGLWVLWGVLFGRPPAETEEVTIPLEGAGQARVRINHGAGRLRVGPGAGPGDLVTGTFGGGVNQRVRRDGETLDVKMSVRGHSFVMPWTWGARGAFDWSVELSGEIPLELICETGASDMRLDLSDLRVTNLRVETGASATDVTLPANAGHTRAKIEAGAASVTVRVPTGVAARIRTEGGLASINVDRNRFPREGRVYRSSDYDTASNKVDLRIEAGVGSINVR